jgi:Flp pilus assembly protein TadG
MSWRTWLPRCRDRSGAIGMIAAISIPVVLGLGGLSVDASYMEYRALQLQAAADAAVLAGSAQLPNITAAQNAAISYAQQNMPTARYGTVLAASDVQTGSWNSTTKTFTAGGTNPTAMRITLRQTTATGNGVGLMFMSMLGAPPVNMTRSAVATYGTSSAWDVMIVQDLSQSFSSEIANSKAADLQLLSCQQNHAGSASQAGLTVFTGFGAVQSTMGNANINGKINSLAQCGSSGMPVCSGSNIAAGLYQALLALTNGTYHPSTNLAGKAVVLLTDGAPNISSGAQAYPTAQGGTYTCAKSGSGKNATPTCTDTDLQNFAQAQATALWAAGISVFTIYYSGSSGTPTTDAAYLASLVRGQGRAYSTPTASQLSTMMTNVCASMPHALVQ